MDFSNNEAMFNIKLQVSIVAHVLCFVLEVRYEFLGGCPIGGFNVIAKVAKHVWRDGEVFRRQGIITVELVKAFWICQVTFYNLPVSLSVGIFIKSKSEISSLDRKRKFPTGNGSGMAVPYKLFASK